MNKFIFLISALSFSVISHAHVSLVYPEGGETFTAGQFVTVVWEENVSHNTMNWDLMISTDGGDSWDILQNDIPYEDLSYIWEVSATLTDQARIRIIQDNDGADYSDESTNFIITRTADSDGIITDSNIRIYPNPFSESTIIYTGTSKFEFYIFSIFDMQGKLAIREKIFRREEFTIHRRNLKRGLYIYKIKFDTGVQEMGKLVIR